MLPGVPRFWIQAALFRTPLLLLLLAAMVPQQQTRLRGVCICQIS
jgi:hypothetical protein